MFVYSVVFFKSFPCFMHVCAHLQWLHVSMAPLSGCWNMVIVRSEYPCARSQFNESHLCHICTFIPLQGEIMFPKQSLPPRQQILMAYPRWPPVSSSHSEAVNLHVHTYEIYGMFAGLSRRGRAGGMSARVASGA